MKEKKNTKNTKIQKKLDILKNIYKKKIVNKKNSMESNFDFKFGAPNFNLHRVGRGEVPN